MIRLTIPPLADDDFQAVRQALASGQLVQGARVAAFEQAVSRLAGVDHAVAVSSCTAALHAGLLALGVGPGDLVVTTAYSWVATANVVELCGAVPVFVDVCPDTFNLDAGCLRATLKRLLGTEATGRRVRAVLPVHTFGQLADMPALVEVAGHYGVPVIEDAACALGATLHGRPAGGWGVMGCFSFHPRKAVTTGEGGVVTTRDAVLARRLRALRNHGLDPEAASPDFILPGLNYRLTEFQAALGLTQLAKLDRLTATRRRLAAQYDALLQHTPVQPPRCLAGARHVYQSYVVLLPEEAVPRRGEIIRALREYGIETTIGTWHMPLTSYFRSRYGYRPGDFPAADAVFARSLTLPLHDRLTEADQARVVHALTGLVR